MSTQIQSPPEESPALAGTKTVSIIFNPVSGQGDPEQRKKIISETLAQHGYTCQFIATSKEQGAKELAKKAVADGVDLLAVSGGDGTVIEAMSALVGTDIPIAVFPAGTGNLLSINLGIPKEVPEAVHVALNGHRYQLDLARTSDDQHFAIMGGVGMDAQMIHDANREVKKRFGVFAYFWAALKNLPRRRASVEITLDDQPPFRRRAKTVEIANMGKITGGLEAMPTASPDDGLLDVGVIKSETLAQWLRLLAYALMGRTQDAPDFEVFQARKIRIRTAIPQPVQYDGEDGGTTRELNLEVLPKAVHILLPEGAPAARDASSSPAAVARKNANYFLVGAGVALLTSAAFRMWKKRR